MHVIPQSWSHLHILIGVFPSIGFVIVLGFYLAGLRSGSDSVRRTCLVLFGLLSLLCVPIYVSGVGSAAALSENARYGRGAIAAHSLWGTAALAVLAVTAAVVFYELWQSRKARRAVGDPFHAIAGLATLPYAAYHFHRVTPYGVVANLLAMPVVSAIVMPAGLLGLVAVPFGFDGVFWRIMELGIEWMMAVAQGNTTLQAAVEAGARCLMPAPLYHSAPNMYGTQALLQGGTLFLESRFDPERVLARIAEHRIDRAYLVPTMFNRLLKLPDAVRLKYDVSSLRCARPGRV